MIEVFKIINGIYDPLTTVDMFELNTTSNTRGHSKKRPKKKNMCVYGHPTHPIFQPPTLTFFISNYSTLIFANDPINFYTEFG